MQKKLIEIRKKQPSCVVRCFLITMLFVSFCCQQIWFIVFIYFFLWFIYYKNTSYQSISNTTARHAITTTKTFSCGLCNFYKLVSHIPACIVKWKWAIGCFIIRKDLKHFRFLLFQATVYFIEIFFIPVSKAALIIRASTARCSVLSSNYHWHSLAWQNQEAEVWD